MNRTRMSLAVAGTLLPLALMLSMGCGLFALPVAGPKALAANAQRMQFSLDIVDPDGNPLPDVTVHVVKYSADVDLLFGEVEKGEVATKVVQGHMDYDAFGLYAVGLTVSKPGYGEVQLLMVNADDLKRQPAPGFYMRMPLREEKRVNVREHPSQHVVLGRIPETGPNSRP